MIGTPLNHLEMAMGHPFAIDEKSDLVLPCGWKHASIYPMTDTNLGQPIGEVNGKSARSKRPCPFPAV